MNLKLPAFVINPPEKRPDPMVPAIAWSEANLIDGETIMQRTIEDAPARFNVLSLPAWLAVAERSQIPFIPAEETGRISVSSFTKSMDSQDGPDELDAFEDKVIQATGDDHVIRFEQVAPAEIKHERSSGQSLGNGSFYSDYAGKNIISLVEDRFYSTLLDLGHRDIISYRRPKYETVDIEGEFRGDKGSWPVEFRVYIFDGEITGISNYYPQVGMNPDVWAKQVRESLKLAQKMIDTMNELKLGIGNHRLAPDLEDMVHPEGWVPSHWTPRDFTLDFLLDKKTGDMVFLEGGPAGLVAAAPCCFEPQMDLPQNILKGFAHTQGCKPLPLEDFL